MKKRMGAAVSVSLGFALFSVLIWKGPWWADAGHLGPGLTPGTGAVVTGFRTAVVAVGAGAVAAVGLFYTDRNYRHTLRLFEHSREMDRQQAELTREGQISDRYSTAISLLSSEETTKRLGGIFALERIMHDSPRDHLMVVEVLAAFIRENAPEPDPANPLYLEDGRKYRPPECVQAALTVLGRRPQRPEPFQIDLKRTDLRGADLAGARLDGACLVKASLRTADLKGASLVGAELRRARLEGADLTGADLTEADVGRAHFRSAHLTNATLSTTRGLTVDQLLQVYKLPGVRLPDELASDARIVAKMTK